MSESPTPIQELRGWKDIAHHLSVSVRTAQKLEKEQGMPVWRGAGVKAPVYAIPTELDNWKKRQTFLSVSKPDEQSQQDHFVREDAPNDFLGGGKPDASFPTRPPTVISGGSENEAATQLFTGRGRGLVLISFVIAMTLGAVSFGIHWFSRGERLPSDFTIEGRVLTVFDKHKRFFWDYEFPDVLFPTKMLSVQWPHKFVDLDGNGHIGLIVGAQNMLYCFDRHGKVVWTYKPGRETLNMQGETVPANYIVSLVDALSRPRQDGGQIVVGSHRGPGALFVVELLTKDGKKVDEYFHFGWFFVVKTGVLGKDGHEDIFLGGVDGAADDHGATLVVLNPDRAMGQSTTELAYPSGAIRGVPPANEKAVLLIKEFGSKPSPVAYCYGETIALLGSSLELFVGQQGQPMGAHFRFDQNLKLQNVLPEVFLQDFLQSTILRNHPKDQIQEVIKRFLGDIIYVRNEFSEGK